MLDKTKFVNLMTGLCDLYKQTLSEFILDIYYKIFQDYDYEQFESAVSKCLKGRVYANLPKPAEIIEYLEGTRDDKALVAWYQGLEAVRKGGYYASVEFFDPIIAHCFNDLGGWQWFCCTQVEELPFLQKRFMDLYRLYLKRGVSVNNIRLIGWHEAQNNQKGQEIATPIRIGFEGRENPQIRQVLAGT